MHRAISALATLLAVGACAMAQTPDLVVGKIDTPDLRWGKHRISFEIANNTDDVKFVVVETQIKFQGEYLNPVRTTHTNHPIEPQFSRPITALVDIPGNYGAATLKIIIFDVVDTLDDLSTATKVFEQPFFLKFHVPDQVAKYWAERITLPPMTSNSPDFDNEFSHVLPVLLNDGRTPRQIAQICMCDTTFVWSIIDRLASHGYMYRNGDTVRNLFAVIGTREAEELKKLADKTSNDLVSLLTKNLRTYGRTLDSLVKADILKPDTNDFLNTGSIAYHRYPMVAAMALWYDMGQKFVAGSEPLQIYYATDPCHARIPNFMYAVQGGDFFNGRQYFDLDVQTRLVNITFGDKVPRLKCPENLWTGEQLKETRDYFFDDNDKYEIFLWDTTSVHPALRALTEGTLPILIATRDKVKAVAEQYVQEKAIHGLKYWFWNLTATQTVDKLVKTGQITRRGNGLYRLTTRRG
ncbi:MAG: hypothetical protein HY851_05025 [candidate division Zixibacteria bacterium]|nr:hypothetical protein [candidate division Zixibacteria bacterium]